MSLINSQSRFKKNRPFELKHKVYLSVSSEGLGHSSRALAIIREFSSEEIIVGSYGYAYERIKSSGYPCVELPQELKLVGKKGAFDVGKTIIKNHSWALKFNKLVNDEIDVIKEVGASCVIADGRLVPVMAADKLGLPCIVLTNQSAFYPFFAKDSALIRVFGKSFDWIMKTWLSSTEEILIPDFSPPYTVCLYNLSHNFKVMKRTRFAGPLVKWDADEIISAPRPDNKAYVVVTLGGHAYRKPILDFVIEVAKYLPDVHFDVFSSFVVENPPSNVKIAGMVTDIEKHLKAADLVITQAGHSTAMELLTLGKQSIIIPDLNQAEQENNAQRMSELGVATKIGYTELTAKSMSEAIKKMLNGATYTDNAVKFAEMAKVIQGRKNTANIIREYSNRLDY